MTARSAQNDLYQPSAISHGSSWHRFSISVDTRSSKYFLLQTVKLLLNPPTVRPVTISRLTFRHPDECISQEKGFRSRTRLMTYPQSQRALPGLSIDIQHIQYGCPHQGTDAIHFMLAQCDIRCNGVWRIGGWMEDALMYHACIMDT